MSVIFKKITGNRLDLINIIYIFERAWYENQIYPFVKVHL